MDGDAQVIFTLDGDTVLTMLGSGSGLGVWVDDIVGWESSATPKSPKRTERVGDGTVDGAFGYSGRTLTVTGWADCASEEDALATARRISALFPSEFSGASHTMGLRVIHHGTDLHASVKPDGVVRAVPDCSARTVDISIPLFAESPYLYGPERIYNLIPPGADYGLDYPLFVNGGVLTYGSDSVTQAVVRNDGSCPAYPTIAVKGNFASGVRLGDGHGHWVTYQGMCVWSQPVYFDFAAKSAYTATGDCSIALTERNFWAVPAHGQVQPVLQPIQAGSGFAELAISDTYM